MADETTQPGTPALVPVREAHVDFYGDKLLAAQMADEEIYVPVRVLCDYLGLSWPGQFERIRRDPVLNEALAVVRVTRTTATGGVPDMVCLPLKFIPGWLFGIQAGRVRAELRDKILRYQRECFDVLWRAFKADIVPVKPSSTTLSGAALALEIGEAITNLARQQLELEGRVTTIADYTRGFIKETRVHQARTEERLTALELRLDPTASITEEQAAELALAVKNVGQRLAAQGEKSGYARVYSELYRRYRISSYKNLPRDRYDEVLAWLHAWHEELGQAGRSSDERPNA